MQVVIDIPYEDFKSITQDYTEYANTESGRVFKAIKNGIPPPKGHGRIVDISKIEYLYAKYDRISWREATEKIKNSVPIIIEADTAD